MPSVRRLRAPRSLLVAVAALVTAPVLAVPGVATAEAPAPASPTETVVGEFVQVWPEYEDPDDAADHGDEGPLSFVQTDDGESVRIDTEDVEHLEVGATVEVTVGREISDTASEELGYAEARNVVDTEVLEAAPAEPTASATAPFTSSVTVVMVRPAGTVQDGRQLGDVVAAVNGPVADFWEEQSRGSIRIGVTGSRDWITTTVGCGNPFALWEEVAGRVGFTQGPGKHLLLYVPSTSANSGCAYGLGTVGYSGSGGMIYVRDVSTSLIVHEFGHNFGLGHSSALQCERAIHQWAGEEYTQCRRTSYWDLYDVMGVSWQRLGSLNAVHARRISGAPEKIFEPYSAPETVTLGAVSEQGAIRAILLRDSQGVQYLLEYRPAAGRDAWLGSAATAAGLQPGVLLRRESTGDDTSLLLDATPSPSTGWDADSQVALPVGTPINVYDHEWRRPGAFVVTVQSVTASAATVQVTPTSSIGFAHQAAGGDGGILGPATAAELCVDRLYGGRYCERAYQNGVIFWTLSTRAHSVTGPLHSAFLASGGALSPWGMPRSDTICGLANGGCRQHFVWSNVYWSSTTGAVPVRDAIRTAYLSIGEEAGVLGYPLAAEVCGSGKCRQDFQGGTLADDPATGTRLVPGEVATVWAAQGYEAGPLGSPTSGLICGLRSGGCGQLFQGGRIYTAPGAGAHALTGNALDAWIRQGAEAGALRYATGDPVCGLAGGRCKQQFQGGVLYWTPTASWVVAGPIGATYAANGSETGALGFPITGVICGLSGGGCGQVFETGRIYTTPQSATHALSGAVLDAWIQQGAEAGQLGYPAGDQVCGLPDGACKQNFAGGLLYSHPTTGTRAVSGALAGVYAAAGGDGALGFPVTGLICGLSSGGCGQVFQTGRIYRTPTTGTHAIAEPVATPWVQSGAEAGSLGYPVTGLICGLTNGGCGQVFQTGRIYTTSAYGTHALAGKTEGAWIRTGAEAGPLGYPAGGQTCGLSGGGCAQTFQGGTVWSHPAAGAHAISGNVASAFAASGAEGGALRYPTSGLICGLTGGGCGQLFQGGRIYTHPTAGTHALTGAIHDAWIGQRAEAGPLGYPTAAAVCGLAGGGCRQTFQGGTLWSAPGTGAHAVSGAVATVWTAAGAEGGTLGYPASGLICGLTNGGCGQLFQGGRIYTHPAAGTRALTGAVLTAWINQRAEAGPLGYPTGDQVCGLADGGCRQAFQGGTLWSHPTAGAHSVSAAFQTVWTAAGGEAGALGYPITGLICGLSSSGCGQVFQNGRIYTTPTTGTHAISGAIVGEWIARGAEAGTLGYPTADAYVSLGGTAQEFQRGAVYSDSSYGTRSISGPIAVRWRAAGGKDGLLGLPTTAASCGLARGGCRQAFASGHHITYAPATGAILITSTGANAWAAEGGPDGPLGYPRSDCRQINQWGEQCLFERGRIDIDSYTGLHSAYVY